MLNKKLTSKDALLKCGDCLFYKSNVKPGSKTCCSQEGVKAVASARACYFPDITKITKDIESFASIATMFTSYTPQQRKILLALLKMSAKSKKKELPFGTKVYVTADGQGRYLSDYLSGYVLGYVNGQCIIAGSPNRKSIGKSFLAYLFPESCLTYSQFQELKRKKIEQGLINNPNRKKVRRIASIENYEPPTIDSAPNEFKKKTKAHVDSYTKISKVLSF